MRRWRSSEAPPATGAAGCRRHALHGLPARRREPAASFLAGSERHELWVLLGRPGLGTFAYWVIGPHHAPSVQVSASGSRKICRGRSCLSNPPEARRSLPTASPVAVGPSRCTSFAGRSALRRLEPAPWVPDRPNRADTTLRRLGRREPARPSRAICIVLPDWDRGGSGRADRARCRTLARLAGEESRRIGLGLARSRQEGHGRADPAHARSSPRRGALPRLDRRSAPPPRPAHLRPAFWSAPAA